MTRTSRTGGSPTVVAALLLSLTLGACVRAYQPVPAPSGPVPSRSATAAPTPSPVAHPPLPLQHAAYLALPFTTILSTSNEDSVGRVLATGTTISSHESLQSGSVWCVIAATTAGTPDSVALVRTPLRTAAGGGLTSGRFWVTRPADCATAAAHVRQVTRTVVVDPVTGVLSGGPTLPDVIDARADVDRFLTGHSPTQDLTTLGIQVYEAVLEVGPSGY